MDSNKKADLQVQKKKMQGYKHLRTEKQNESNKGASILHSLCVPWVLESDAARDSNACQRAAMLSGERNFSYLRFVVSFLLPHLPLGNYFVFLFI